MTTTSGRVAPELPEIVRIDRTSLTRKTREAVLELILARRFADGRLPAEGSLAELLGVSRTTVRAALLSLQQDGFITRRRGAGTVVNHNVVASRLGLHRLVGFSTLLREAGHEPSVDVDVELHTSLSDSWRKRLQVPVQTTAYVLIKLFRADGKPAIAVVDVIPVDSLSRELDFEAIPDSIFELFSTSGKRPIDHAVVELAPQNASTAVARRLRLNPGAAYLELVESHYAAGAAQPVAVSFIDVNDRYVRFDVVRRTA
jgi:GntR family transcriptional regulator